MIPFAVMTVVLPIAVVWGVAHERKRKGRVTRLTEALGAQVKGEKIAGYSGTIPYEIRYTYTGKGRHLTSVAVCTPFEGYPFRFRKSNYGDELLVHLSKRLEDFQVGDADFDKKFHVSAAAVHKEWMTGYVHEPGRLDALEWFFTAGYSSVHSNGGRIFATYPAVYRTGFENSLEKESSPVWDTAFIRKSLAALEQLTKAYRAVPYDSWEEWWTRMLKEGPRLEGRQLIITASLAAIFAWINFKMGSTHS